MSIDTIIAEVRRLDAEATKAPWAPRYYEAKDMADLRAIVADLVNDGVGTRFHFVSDNDNPDLITGASGNGPTSEANTALISYYRTAAPALAAEVERLRAEVKRAWEQERIRVISALRAMSTGKLWHKQLDTAERELVGRETEHE